MWNGGKFKLKLGKERKNWSPKAGGGGCENKSQNRTGGGSKRLTGISVVRL